MIDPTLWDHSFGPFPFIVICLHIKLKGRLTFLSVINANISGTLPFLLMLLNPVRVNLLDRVCFLIEPLGILLCSGSLILFFKEQSGEQVLLGSSLISFLNLNPKLISQGLSQPKMHM